MSSTVMLNGSEVENISVVIGNRLTMDQGIDPQADNFLGFWLLTVLGTFIGFIGLFGNVCSIIVLSHKQMRSSPNFILIALSFSDLILIITSNLMFGWREVYLYSGMMKNYFFKYFPYVTLLAYPLGLIGEVENQIKSLQLTHFNLF
jgi:hypothetical protein